MKARTFEEILKFNPYHDAKGRFSTADSHTSFTVRTRDPNKQALADAAREREIARTGGAASTTEEETPQMKAVHEIEDAIRHNDYETAAVVNSDGDSVIYKAGGTSQVGFTPMECMMMRNNVLTHNHPRSSMLSAEDALCFVRNDLSEMRATTREGKTYSIKRGDGYDRNKGMDFVKDYDTNYDSAIRYAQRDLDSRGFSDKIFSGEITRDQANTEFGRVVANVMVSWSIKNAPGYGIDFSVETRAVNKSAAGLSLSKADSDGEEVMILDNATEAKLDAAFNEWLDSTKKSASVAKTFDEIIEVEKFNPYHDRLGRFATAGSAISFTYAPGKSKAHDNAIAGEKDRISAIMPTAEQNKTLRSIENRTRNLKKEQFRVVDREGNVVMQKQGDQNSVSYTVGEARDNFPGNITIHNHPDGGTFSSADLSDIGYGATEIRAAAPEGTYTLRNMSYKSKLSGDQKSWYEMREDLEAATQNFKTDRQLKKELRKSYEEQLQPLVKKWEKLRADNAPMEEQRKVADEYTRRWDEMKPQLAKDVRAAYVAQYDSWYKSNAGKYGLEYTFTPTRSRTAKGDTMIDIEEIEKSSGEIVLDRKIREDVEEIMDDILSEFPRELESKEAKKSFSVFKTDDDKRLVFGWASVSITVDGEQLEDRQKDIIDPDDLEAAAYEYVLNFRDTGEEHIPTMRKKGKLVESCVFTPEKMKAIGIPEGILPIGWWIGFKIEDDAAWEKVKNGTYKMFSIEGKARRVPV